MILTPSTLFANINNQLGDELTILTQEIPTGAWEFVNEHFEFFLYASITSDSVRVGNETFLGTPFTIPSAYILTHYFPIISDGIFVGTFRVFVDELQSRENGQITYAGIMSPYLANEFNMLLASSRMRSLGAITLHYDNGNLMVDVDGASEVLSSSPRGDLPVGNMPRVVFGDDLVAVSPIAPAIHYEASAVMPLSTFSQTILGVQITERQWGHNRDWAQHTQRP